ncbi:hypothetical protein I79_012534 [Cricetulus griseus]|uniref:Uncharacterized protein n=1 Tax=Cricetulus griseus TaxID=10029 RepID=G3HP31_CRIGR|nr:hypothetical protein I79_012534 [Cricetulus griseus]
MIAENRLLCTFPLLLRASSFVLFTFGEPGGFVLTLKPHRQCFLSLRASGFYKHQKVMCF